MHTSEGLFQKQRFEQFPKWPFQQLMKLTNKQQMNQTQIFTVSKTIIIKNEMI